MPKHKCLFALFSLLCCGVAGLVIYGQITNQVTDQTTNQATRGASRVAPTAATTAPTGQAVNRAAPAAMPQVIQLQTAQEIPEQYLYQHFLAHLKHLEDKSKKPERKPGEETLNEYYKMKLKLTEGDYQALLDIANEYDTEMSDLMARLRETVKRHRAEHPGGKLASRDQVPIISDEIKDLQREYEEMLARYRDRAKVALSSAKNIELASYLKQEFGSQLRIKKVDLPREKDPGKQKLPPLEK